MLTQIVLVRHGKPLKENSLLGSTDSALSFEGVRQLERSTKQLHKITKVISSPLKRCSDYASVFSRNHHLDLIIDENWQECHFGNWDGINYSQISEKFPEAYYEFLTNPVLNTPPNAETLNDFYSRIMKGIESIIEKYSGEKVLIFTHAGVIRCLVAWCLNMDFINISKLSNTPFQRLKIDYASITKIDIWKDTSLLPQSALLPQLVSLNQCPQGDVEWIG